MPGVIEHTVFAEGRLSIGLTLPMLSSGNAVADFDEQIALARLADELGFAALWVRDVPLNSSDYPDPVGHLDPWVLLGAVASHTKNIALASGAIVLTLRHPLHIAKGAVSVNTLSRGRFILGLGSGDRPHEYAAFGIDANERREVYRRHWDTVAAAIGREPRVIPDQSPPDAPEFFLLPTSPTPVPMIAVGSGGQSVDWIARNAIGLMTYHREPEKQRARYSMWRAAVDRVAPGEFRAFGVAMGLDLAADQNEAAEPRSLGYRTGSNDLIRILREMRENGTHHVTLNLQASKRPTREILEELAAEVLPEFQIRA
ncbi:LLM class oxidoreductase [Caballeronia sordidicola]|uniref:Coenzyme F420-dependent N5,N10-methylene tetrahydromethanopterin reductase n=1 Tax=Caballeronia sordidicola TaxID=196367 RepID=A0A242MSY4_CABSO|nr:LLM class oxidoreductase [Caballeronia sordidicola]OTP74496.1 Coenzyme F420-dependent N5,N10-methylene tetrahydromethanopterin reductase [Caballeronia sordidicola]